MSFPRRREPSSERKKWVPACAGKTIQTFLSSIRLHAGLADDVAPLGDLALDVGGEFLRRAGERQRAGGGELVFHFRRVHGFDELGVEPVDDAARRRRWGEYAVPGGDLEV